mgnify:CR=1 FL=1
MYLPKTLMTQFTILHLKMPGQCWLKFLKNWINKSSSKLLGTMWQVLLAVALAWKVILQQVQFINMTLKKCWTLSNTGRHISPFGAVHKRCWHFLVGNFNPVLPKPYLLIAWNNEIWDPPPPPPPKYFVVFYGWFFFFL